MNRIRAWTFAGLIAAGSAIPSFAAYSSPFDPSKAGVVSVSGVVQFSGGMVSGTVGQPNLPRYKVSFLLPYNTDFSTVTFALKDTAVKLLDGEFIVNPVPPPYDKSGNPIWPSGVKIVDGKDMSVYSKQSFFPLTFKGAVSTNKMRQYVIADVVICPYLYNPTTRRLRTITSGSIVVTSSVNPSAPALTEPRCSWAEDMIKTMVVNPSLLDQYNPPQTRSLAPMAPIAGATGYVIITNDNFMNFPTFQYVLNNFAAQKQSQGFTVTYATESTFGGTPGPDRADKIRNYLITNWPANKLNIRYVLFIGDPDPNDGDVPMDNPSSPNDYIYTTLDGDGLAEVAVGRIPVYDNNINMAMRVLNKTISYESDGNTEWRRYALLPMKSTHPGEYEGYDFGESIRTNILYPKKWQWYRLYDYCPVYNDYFPFLRFPEVINMNPLPEQVGCTYDLVLKAWNKTNPGIVAWTTHGQPYAAMDVLTATTWPDGPPTIAELNPAYPAMVLQGSCGTAEPEKHDNLATQVLWYGAVSTVAATRSAGADNLRALGQSYIDAITSNTSCGDAFNQATAATSSIGTHWVLYGCPEVSLNLRTVPLYNPPTNIKATVLSASKVRISWTPVTDGVATGYRIEFGNATSDRWTDFSLGSAGVVPTATYYDFNGMTPNTLVKYRVCAVYTLSQVSTFGPWAPIDSVSTLDAQGNQLMPATPTSGTFSIATLTPPDNRAQLNFSQSMRGATSYNIKRSVASTGPFVTIGNVPVGTMTFDDKDLINGTTYYYVISSVNQWGQSANSPALSVKPVATLPTKPVLTATVTSPTHIQLTWTPSSINVEQYIVHWKRTDGKFNSIGDGSIKFDYPTTSYDLVLENNATYDLWVGASNGVGENLSAIVTKTTPIGNAPAVPTFKSLTATCGNGPIAVATWVSPANATNMNVYVSVDGAAYTCWESVVLPATSYTVIGSPNSTVKVLLRAVKVNSAIGEIVYSDATASLTAVLSDALPFIMPRGTLATAVSNSSISLTWNQLAYQKGIRIYRSPLNENNYTLRTTLAASALSYTDGGLAANTLYYYKIVPYSNCSNGGTQEGSYCTVNATTLNNPVSVLGSWVVGTTHTKETGYDRALVVFVYGEHTSANMAVSSVTYSGRTMTKVVEKNQGTTERSYTAAYILNEAGVAAATSGTIVVNWTTAPTTGRSAVMSVFLSNVNQTTLTASPVSAGTAAATSIATTAITKVSGDMAILGATAQNNGTYTFSSTASNNFLRGGTEQAPSWGDITAGYLAGTGTSATPKVTISASMRQSLVGFIVKKR